MQDRTPTGWERLSDRQDREAWELIGERLAFRPGTHPEDWPAITEPTPSRTWDLAGRWRARDAEGRTPPDRFDVADDRLGRVVMAALRDCTGTGEAVLALDWQHPGYRCTPTLVSDDDVARWPVAVLPNGDYHAFVEPRLRFGVFGHPWEATLCVFGEALIRALSQRNAGTLTTLLRRDGEPVPPRSDVQP